MAVVAMTIWRRSFPYGLARRARSMPSILTRPPSRRSVRKAQERIWYRSWETSRLQQHSPRRRLTSCISRPWSTAFRGAVQGIRGGGQTPSRGPGQAGHRRDCEARNSFWPTAQPAAFSRRTEAGISVSIADNCGNRRTLLHAAFRTGVGDGRRLSAGDRLVGGHARGGRTGGNFSFCGLRRACERGARLGP